MEDVKRTPLEQEHVALAAKMGDFAGWRMPISYAGTLAEHRAVREEAGIFDLTHLGKITVEGPGAIDLIQRVVTNDVGKIDVGGAQYNLVLNRDGGIVDDILVYRPGDESYLVVPNAANVEAVHALLSEAEPKGAAMRHRPDLVTIAVQGPRAAGVLEADVHRDRRARVHALRGDVDPRSDDAGGQIRLHRRAGLRAIPHIRRRPLRLAALARCRVSDRPRTGGPRGQRHPSPGDGLPALRERHLPGADPHGGRPDLGGGAREGSFTGQDRLEWQKERGPALRLRGLVMNGKLIPQPHCRLFDGDKQIGETTSGTFSPTLNRGIALGYVQAAVEPGETVEIEVRGRRGRAEIIKPPFVDRDPRAD